MLKTAPPGQIAIFESGTFNLNVLPDIFDARDLPYRASLMPLPPVVDTRSNRHVMKQEGDSCTGHALAALINNLLRHTGELVSPYMLYDLARRYDEFEGEADVGSSLRGVLKGWYHHGVLLEEDWGSDATQRRPDLTDPDVRAECLRRPMGAYYRIDPTRLDDLQSAINEIGSVCVSAVIHNGWVKPDQESHRGESLHVIRRASAPEVLGGHAFALVGYNEIGFLVQNSWGKEWGAGGFATLPYDEVDLLDAWVARLGVPGTPPVEDVTRMAVGTQVVSVSAPDPLELMDYVVNIGNDGMLADGGRFRSTPAQIDRIFTQMAAAHDTWQADGGDDGHNSARDRARDRARDIVLYAHGGLNDAANGFRIAQANFQWWRNNRIYPVFFAWQTGPAETLLDQLMDLVHRRAPIGAGMGWFTEGVDRLAENLARTWLKWAWDQMKDNAALASAEGDGGAIPGATLTALRLREYVNAHRDVKVHLVGHSAGAIFLAGLVGRLAALGVRVETLSLLAPAIRVDDFAARILPHIQSGQVKSFVTFALSDELERHDVCGAGALTLYHKSILYLVSRGFEGPQEGREVPLLGMEKFFDLPIPGTARSLRQAIAGAGGTMIFSRTFAPPVDRCDATTHSSFDSNSLTLTSVTTRILGLKAPNGEGDYHPFAIPRR